MAAAPALAGRDGSSIIFWGGSSIMEDSGSIGVGGRGPWGWFASASDEVKLEDFAPFGYCIIFIITPEDEFGWQDCCWAVSMLPIALTPPSLTLGTQ